MGSALLYKDLDNTSTQDMLVFCVSLLCVAIGVALVSKREGASSDSSADNDADRNQYDNVRFILLTHFRYLILGTFFQVPLLAAIDEGDFDPRATAARKTSMLVL